jgi:hypothetical protein
MTFVLPTSYLLEKILHKIEQKAIGALLCKGGFVSTFPRKVVFGPHCYGGIAMRPLKIEQLSKQNQAVLKHLQCLGENHDMLCITLAWAQLGTGMGFVLLEKPNKRVPHLECAWIQSIRISSKILVWSSFIVSLLIPTSTITNVSTISWFCLMMAWATAFGNCRFML